MATRITKSSYSCNSCDFGLMIRVRINSDLSLKYSKHDMQIDYGEMQKYTEVRLKKISLIDRKNQIKNSM